MRYLRNKIEDLSDLLVSKLVKNVVETDRLKQIESKKIIIKNGISFWIALRFDSLEIDNKGLNEIYFSIELDAYSKYPKALIWCGSIYNDITIAEFELIEQEEFSFKFKKEADVFIDLLHNNSNNIIRLFNNLVIEYINKTKIN